MPHFERDAAAVWAVFLMALAVIVHVAGAGNAHAQKAKAPSAAQSSASGSAAAPPAPEIRYGVDGLPPSVIEMREAIQAAVRSGRIDDLLPAIEMNEIKPSFGEGPVPDPIAHLKQQSQDGEGRDILEALGRALDAGYAVVPLGRDIENNRIYVWPYFAETGIDRLTAKQEGELARLVEPQAIAAMREKGGRYAHWRLGIAADGTWHLLAR